MYSLKNMRLFSVLQPYFQFKFNNTIQILFTLFDSAVTVQEMEHKHTKFSDLQTIHIHRLRCLFVTLQKFLLTCIHKTITDAIRNQKYEFLRMEKTSVICSKSGQPTRMEHKVIISNILPSLMQWVQTQYNWSMDFYPECSYMWPRKENFSFPTWLQNIHLYGK